MKLGIPKANYHKTSSVVPLKRKLGLADVTLYGVGIILGAGIYALIGDGARLTGSSLWISFMLGAIIASFTGLSYAELASMFPKAAAEYVYVKMAFGNKLLAFLIGWLILFTTITTIATVSLGFAGYFYSLFNSPPVITAIALIILLSTINYFSIQISSKVNIIFTLIEISGLLLVIFLALINFKSLSTINYLSMPHGLQGMLSATALVFFAFIGFEDIANISEETRNPQKVLSIAFILAILITTLLYVLTAIAAIGLSSINELSNSSSPLAFAASKTFLGQKAFIIMSIIALFATANTILVAMIVHSRMIYGMAIDHSLPEFLSYVSEKRRTPYFAILLLMLLSIFSLFLGGLTFLANLTSFATFLTFSFVNLSVIILRFKAPNIPRRFKTFLNIKNFPVLAALGLLSSLFMTFQFPLQIFLVGVCISFFGLIVFKILST